MLWYLSARRKWFFGKYTTFSQKKTALHPKKTPLEEFFSKGCVLIIKNLQNRRRRHGLSGL
jgi:hypothetical protein